MKETDGNSVRACVEYLIHEYGGEFNNVRKWLYRQIHGYPSNSRNENTGALYSSYTAPKIHDSYISKDVEIRNGREFYELKLDPRAMEEIERLYKLKLSESKNGKKRNGESGD